MVKIFNRISVITDRIRIEAITQRTTIHQKALGVNKEMTLICSTITTIMMCFTARKNRPPL
ncbi:MAG: hypothetical protein GX825_10340 [Syntrophomonadaceae bacterium]|nr:hypothetical protein [Syntrophomonadaceae bacterium]